LEGLVLKAAVLFTGGKDSVTALHYATRDGFEVAALLSIIPHYKYSMLYHQPIYQCLIAQAQSLRIPLESIGLIDPSLEREALKYLLERARSRYGIEVLVAGAVKSVFQYRVFSEVAGLYGLKLYTPLWGINEEEYLYSLLNMGIEFTLISITSMGIPHDLLGKTIDKQDVERIISLSKKYGFNPSFEGGDAETLVVNAPLFKYKIALRGRRVIVSEYEGYFIVEEITLLKK
jgi:predicted ATP pyrophosphatase (TIGR00289 family)